MTFIADRMTIGLSHGELPWCYAACCAVASALLFGVSRWLRLPEQDPVVKRLLLKDEKQIARNLAEQLIVYATGTPVSFADRAEVGRIVIETAENKHRVRSLVHAVIQSDLFLKK